MCRLYSLYSLYRFIYNIDQVELGFKAAISETSHPAKNLGHTKKETKKRRNIRTNKVTYGGVLAHCLKIDLRGLGHPSYLL